MTAPDIPVHLRRDGQPSAHEYNHQQTSKPFHLYRVYGRRNRLLYIGITTSVKRRMSEHGRRWREPVRVQSELVGPQRLARILEAAATARERPRDNGLSGDNTGREVWRYLEDERVTLDEFVERHRIDAETVASWLRWHELGSAYREKQLRRRTDAA